MAAVAGVLLGDRFVIDQGVDFIVRHITIDDSYYYLNTAWNTRHLGWVTFDGVNPTNGVQFLWFWMLYLYSFAFTDRIEFLFGALWLCAALSALSVAAAWRLGSLLRGWRGGVLLAGFVAFGATGAAYLRVLENTVHLLVFILAVDQYLRLLRDQSVGAASVPRRFLVLFGLLSLNAWSRLDAGAFSAAIGLHAAWVVLRDPALPHRRRNGVLAAGAAICLIAATVQLAGYRLMGGSFVPVSGLWKTGATALGEVPSLLWLWWGRPLEQVFPFEQYVPKEGIHRLAFALTFLVLAKLLLGRRQPTAERKALDAGIAVVIGGLAFHAICMMALVDVDAVRRGVWYQAPQMALMALIQMLALAPPPRGEGEGASGFPLRPHDLVAVPVLLYLIYYAALSNRHFVVTRQGRTNFHGQRLELARWIDANLEPGARLAAFNSGELGYFSGRSVTNLDGLINSYAYREYRRGGGSVADYLLREKIDYFVDYQSDEAIDRITELIHTQPVPEREPIEVRRVVRPAEAPDEAQPPEI